MKSNTTVESIQDGIENGNESTAFAHLKKDQSMTSIPIFFIKTPCHNQLEKKYIRVQISNNMYMSNQKNRRSWNLKVDCSVMVKMLMLLS